MLRTIALPDSDWHRITEGSDTAAALAEDVRPCVDCDPDEPCRPHAEEVAKALRGRDLADPLTAAPSAVGVTVQPP